MIDESKLQAFVARRRDAQNLGLGLLGGVIGAALGALAWAAVTALTQFQIGWMSIGVGFLTGFGVRILGKGVPKVFGYVGAVLSLVGCAAGNVLAALMYIAAHDHIPFATLLERTTPTVAWGILTDTFSVMDIVFYGIALYFGYRYSFHRITPQELAALQPDPEASAPAQS